ncbi:MAG: thrombospondin type 3 repeat-containing protein [bacterium]
MRKTYFFLFFIFMFLGIFAEGNMVYPTLSPEMMEKLDMQMKMYPKIDLSYPIYAFDDQRNCSDDYSIVLDLNDDGYNSDTHRIVSLANCGGNFVTPLKDQRSYGTCWAFGKTAIAETALMIDINEDQDPSFWKKYADLSEAFLAYNIFDGTEYEDRAWIHESLLPYSSFLGEERDGFAFMSDNDDNICDFYLSDETPGGYFRCYSFPGWIRKMFRKKYPDVSSCRNVVLWEDLRKCLLDSSSRMDAELIISNFSTLDAEDCADPVTGEITDFVCADQKIKRLIDKGFALNIHICSDKIGLQNENYIYPNGYSFSFQTTEIKENVLECGGHSVVIVGYAESIDGSGEDYFLVKNSWYSQVDENALLLFPTISSDYRMKEIYRFSDSFLGIFVNKIKYGKVDKVTGQISESDNNRAFSDIDSDGMPDWLDSCPNKYDDPSNPDYDHDGINNSCDLCPEMKDSNKMYQDLYLKYPFHIRLSYDDGAMPMPAFDADNNSNGVPDICEERGILCGGSDSDRDGVGSSCDNCPNIFNPYQYDSDFDGDGDECDPCPYNPSINRINPGKDSDGDGIADECDVCKYDTENTKGYLTSFGLSDKDNDYIPDICDNCPHISNYDYQDDTDGDGIGDICDSCPDSWSYFDVLSAYNEIANNECKEYQTLFPSGVRICIDGGHRAMQATNRFGYFTLGMGSAYEYNWQPDHDLDGLADMCDNSFYYSKIAGVESPAVSSLISAKNKVLDVFVSAPSNYGYVSVGNYEVRTKKLSDSTFNINTNPYWLNSSLLDKITVEVSAPNSIHFCGKDINNIENKTPDEEGIPYGWRYDECAVSSAGAGFGSPSHGTERRPVDDRLGRPRWEHISWSEDRKTAENIPFNTEEDPDWEFNSKYKKSVNVPKGRMKRGIYWNWRADAWLHLNCYDDPDSEFCQSLKRSEAADTSTTFFYTLSTAQKGESEEYIIKPSYMNPAYFADKPFYTRSARYSVYAKKVAHENIFSVSTESIKEVIKNLFAHIKNVSLFITPSVMGLNDIRFGTDGKLLRVPVDIPDNFLQIFEDESGIRYVITESVNNEQSGKRYFVKVMYPGSSDWETIGEIDNYPERLKKSALTVFENRIYIAGGEWGDNMQNDELSILEKGEQALVFRKLSDLPSDIYNIRMFVAGKILYLIGNARSEMKLYRFTRSGMKFEDTGFTGPLSKDTYTIKAVDNGFFLGGGISGDVGTKDLWYFNPEAGWKIVSGNLGYDFFALLIEKHDDRIVLVNPYSLNDDGFATKISINLNDYNDVVTETVSLPWNKDDKFFCISEKNNSIFPGINLYDEECKPVTDYNYDTVSYFDYKFTVAGYKNSLYLGGLTGVRRVEIDENGTLTNKEMLYTGETNNLAVHESTMYGANYGEIDIYAIAENGSASRIKGINSSSCGDVRVSGDKLFTAENERVRIFDLTDPQNPELVKTIATAGKVIDLEVIGERLYIYEETTSWFTTKGFTGIYDISDLNSPTRTHYFEKRCTDAEMQKSGETVYLGCKNGQNKITDSGLVTVNGEKNYVREGYVYDSILYQVFSGALHKSKIVKVPAVCGNGFVETGEVCDGNSVACNTISSSYVSGTAYCNSTCNGYNESNCSTDGW